MNRDNRTKKNKLSSSHFHIESVSILMGNMCSMTKTSISVCQHYVMHGRSNTLHYKVNLADATLKCCWHHGWWHHSDKYCLREVYNSLENYKIGQDGSFTSSEPV